MNGLVATSESSGRERIIFRNPASDVSFYYTSSDAQGFEVPAFDSSNNLLRSISYYWDLSNSPYIIYAMNTYEDSLPQKPRSANIHALFAASGISYIELQPNFRGGVVIDDLCSRHRSPPNQPPQHSLPSPPRRRLRQKTPHSLGNPQRSPGHLSGFSSCPGRCERCNALPATSPLPERVMRLYRLWPAVRVNKAVGILYIFDC